MTDDSQQLFKVLDKYGQEVAAYFESEFQVRQVKEVAKNHRMEFDQVADLVEAVVLTDFDLANVRQTSQNIGLVVYNDFVLDFIVTVFGPISGYLKKAGVDAEAIVGQLGGSTHNFAYLRAKLEKELALVKEDQLVAHLQKMIDAVDVRTAVEDYLKVLSGEVCDYLKSDPDPFLDYQNWLLIYLLRKDAGFIERAVKALLANNQLLTSGFINNTGKKIKPTVSAWLNDFISKVGGGRFENLAMAQYLSNSENVNSLPPKGKENVRRLILLYKNIKFFPRSMEGIKPEKWRVLPIPASVAIGDKLDEANKPNIAPEKDRDLPTIKATPITWLIQPKLTSLQEKQVAELRAMASNYVPGSLERRAIEEQIKKIESN